MERVKKLVDGDSLILIGRGIIVGAIVGLLVGSFRWLIGESISGWQFFYQKAHTNQLWLLGILAALIIMGIFIGILLKQQPHIGGSGIPEVEIQLRGRLDLNWWKILWRKYVGGLLAIGSGLFLGREGPSIQLGSTVGQGVASLFKTSKTNGRTLIACGAASGLAAAFNAPMAGTMFVLEEIFHNFSSRVWISALAGSVTANFVTSNIFGLKPVLSMKHVMNFPLAQYWQLIVLGVVLGLLGLMYQKNLLAMPKLYAKIKFLPRYFDGLIPLVLVIPVGYFWPDLLGGGNGLILNLNRTNLTVLVLLGIFILRYFFSMVSYGSGLPGGIFLPILTLGAVAGALYGQVMVNLGLLSASLIPNLIIFAMAGYFAGIGKAPFTAILLITEMVGNLSHLMPLAIVSLVAYLTVDVLRGAPIYESLAEKMLADQMLDYSGKTDQLTVCVEEGSSLAGNEVRNIKWPEKTLLVKITRGERFIIPNGQTTIHVGDFITMVVDSNKRLAIREQLSKHK